MYINQKWTVVKGNDIKNKAKIASIVFEERKMQNKYNSIHHRRNMFLVVTMAGRENRDAVCLSVYGRVTERGTGAPNFGPRLLWPNGWMDRDTTWYRGMPWPRRHYVSWGPSSPRKVAQQPPPLCGPCLLWPNGRPSQQVQSSCIVILCQKSSQLS